MLEQLISHGFGRSPGASIAAAGGVTAAVSATSTVTLTAGVLSVASDVTSIASGALEEASPKASSILGWVSLGTGLAGLGVEGVTAARGATARLHESAAPLHGPEATFEGTVVREAEAPQLLTAAPAHNDFVELNPAEVYFTQTTSGTPRYLARSMRRMGWQGDPIDVVDLPEGLASIDNRRLAAARRINAKRPWRSFRVRARIHAAEEGLPPEMVGRFGPDARTSPGPGAMPPGTASPNKTFTQDLASCRSSISWASYPSTISPESRHRRRSIPC